MNQFFRRLSTRLYLVLSISVCLIFVALVTVSIKVQERTLKEQSEQTLEQLTDVFRITLDVFFSTRLQSLQNLVDNLERWEHHDHPTLEDDSALKELFDHIWIVNRAGRLVDEWPRLGAIEESLSLARHPLFIRARNEQAILIGDPEMSYYTDELVIHLVAPMFSDEDFIGIVVGSFSLKDNAVLNRIVSTQIGHSGVVTIANREARVIAHPDSFMIGRHLSAEQYPLLHQAINNRWEGVKQTRGGPGNDVIQSIRWLNSTDWLVTTTIAMDEAMQPADNLRRIQLIVGFGSLVFSVVLLFWIVRSYLRPMNRLQHEVVAVQQGKQEQLTEPGIDELRQLVYRFNNLLAQNRINRTTLEQRQAYMDKILESSSAGLFMTDEQGNMEYVNPHLIDITGYSAKELIESGMARNITENQRQRVVERFNMAMQDQARMAVEFEFYHGDGKLVWLSLETVPVFSAGLCIGYVGTVHDITSQQEKITALQLAADEDPLTRLLNRRGVEKALTSCFVEARVNNKPLLVLALDLDNFKAVNDKLGHAVGDDVLRQVAELMRRFTRDTDFLGRLGGDEFIIILPGCPAIRGERIAEELQRTISALTRERDDFPDVTVSIGLVGLRPGDASALELIRRADKAAYDAKHAGRNRWISDLP